MLLETFQSQPFAYRLPGNISGGAQAYHAELTTPPRIYGEEYDGGGVTVIFLNQEQLIDGYEVIYLWLTQNMVFFPGFNYTLYRFNATTGEYLGRIDSSATLFIFSRFAQALDGTIYRCDETFKVFKCQVDPVLGVTSDGVVAFDFSLFAGITSVDAFNIDASNNIVLLGANVANQLRIHNLATGALISTVTLPANLVQIMPESAGRCYVMTADHVMCLIDYTLGIVLSSFRIQDAFNPALPGVTVTWDTKYRRFLSWVYTPPDTTGQNTSTINGYFPMPIATALMDPIPLAAPRKYNSVPVLTRLFGDLGEPIGGAIIDFTPSVDIVEFIGFPAITDGDGEAVSMMTDLDSGTVIVTASLDDGSGVFTHPTFVTPTVGTPTFTPSTGATFSTTSPPPIAIHNMEGINNLTATHVLNIAPTTNLSPHNMTSNNSPSPYEVSATSTNGWNAFDGDLTTYWQGLDLGIGWWLELNLGVGNRRILAQTPYSYQIQMPSTILPDDARAPRDWTVDGSNDGTTWITLGAQSGETTWGAGELRHYTVSPTTVAYQYFRLLITANNGDPTYTIIGELSFIDSLPPILAGEVLVVVFGANASPISWDSGWTRLGAAAQSLLGFYHSAFAKVATGGETTFTINTASAQASAWSCYRITGGSFDILTARPDVVAAALVSGSGSCQPPSLTLSGVRNALFIATYGGYTHIATATPSGFSNLRTAAWGGMANISTAELAISSATTEGPGAFTNPSDNWVSTTLAVIAPATFKVFITTPTSGAAIYYTTDRSTPTSASTLYTGPFFLSASATLKAIAIRAGYIDSNVVTAVYTLLSGSPVSPSTPTSPVLTAGDGEVSINAVTGFDGGASVIYSAITDTGKTGSSTYFPFTITGTPNGTPVNATVTATNSAGSSPASAVSNTVTPGSSGPVPGLPFDMPDLATMFGSSKVVFAHYFGFFPLSFDNLPAATDYYNESFLTIGGEGGSHAAYGGYLRQRPLSVPPGDPSTYVQDNMETEIRMAMARGITAFAFDVLNLADALNPTGKLQTLLAAAAVVDARFMIMVMLDMSSLGAITAADSASIIEAVASKPNIYTLSTGEILFAAYNASLKTASYWTSMMTTLAGAGITTKFIPVLLGGPSDAGSLDPVSYGLGAWGTAIPSAAIALQPNPAIAHGNGLKYMMPISMQQFRSKDQIFWEANNSQTMRKSWESAINGGSDWVQYVTWSDFSESSQIQPCTDATLNPNMGNGFSDLGAYYAASYLTGSPPTIVADRLYYFYRRMPIGAAHPSQVDNFTCVAGTPSDLIEVVAMLTAPGTITISVGTASATFSAPSGLSVYTMPLAAGTPILKLNRGTTTVISASAAVQIFGSAGDPAGTLDYTYWSGSVAPTPDPLDMEPSSDFHDAVEGVAYTQTLTGSGGVKPYVWGATGVPSWATPPVISSDTTTWTIAGMPPMSTSMNTIAVTLTDSS
jgi:hypothetical protein